MKKNILLPSLLMIALIGCATVSDLNKVRSEIDQKITVEVGGKIVPMEKKVAVAEESLAALKTESAAIRGDVGKNSEAVAAIRRSMAETSADIADIRDNLQQLRGQLDLLRKDLAAAATRANRKDEEYKEIRDKLNNAVFKINFIENFLGIGAREDQPEAAEKGEKLRETSKGKPDKESAYVAAYELFKDGKFDKAREAFLNFLKQYPDTEYSDNAQFWLGECFYFEKKYENAILEYEKVAQNYPDGDRVPHALLKQGISFLNLGDKASAKLILQRVISDYPNTNQARTAKAQLLTIK
ncbi:MAG TPA: tol-pal system protein YbgF [Syntrophales bacterium]|nr:tol-pal system protein YbgF [Syntrophales bacterium]